MLKDGKRLIFIDLDEENEITLTYENFCNGVNKYIESGADTDIDLWDGEDCDCAMQYALFGEIIYG